jgi:hypothetical protein
LVAASLLALAGTAIAAKPVKVRSGSLVLAINGGVTPKKLPRGRLAPIKLEVSANIGTNDGTQPPVAKTVTIDFDKHGKVNARGLRTCKSGRIESTTTAQAKRACPKAIVGGGRTSVRVAFPESTPFTASGPLVVFNGGVKGGVTRMYIHAYVSVPAPTAIVTEVRVKRIHKGRYGTRAVARIPVIAGGSGALTRFALHIKRSFRRHGTRQSYLLARCANGRFYANGSVAFAGGSRLAGTITRPCTPGR